RARYSPVALASGPARPDISALSLHDALPILLDVDTATLDVVTRLHPGDAAASDVDETLTQAGWALRAGGLLCLTVPVGGVGEDRSEEHTSELQSRENLVCRLLREKKNHLKMW